MKSRYLLIFAIPVSSELCNFSEKILVSLSSWRNTYSCHLVLVHFLLAWKPATVFEAILGSVQPLSQRTFSSFSDCNQREAPTAHGLSFLWPNPFATTLHLHQNSTEYCCSSYRTFDKIFSWHLVRSYCSLRMLSDIIKTFVAHWIFSHWSGQDSDWDNFDNSDNDDLRLTVALLIIHRREFTLAQ